MLNNKSILITGGTGSFGRKFVQRVLEKFPSVKRLVIFSRDELKQFEMSHDFSPAVHKSLQYCIGDVRDAERLKQACEGIDYIIHTAALKQMPTAEYNPIECIKTNVLGAENVINSAKANNVKKVLALSTDKAAAPINLYGATKLCSDKLFVAANNSKGNRDLGFSVVRYGNVMGSRGSVIPFFLNKRKEGVIPITHEQMTRFNITPEEGVNMVLWALDNMWGGEIFVPKIPSYRILELAEAIAPNCETKIIGMRPGEKIHEEMITEADSLTTYDLGRYYAILPPHNSWKLDEFVAEFAAKRVPQGFKYNSDTNEKWLSVGELRSLIKKYVDSEFEAQ